jgi:Uma2 family endonuclease
MSTKKKHRYTPAEYLELERAAEVKSEYLNGEIFLMSGASRRHNLVTGNVFRLLSSQLLGRPCETYTGDMRVRVSEVGLYTYPDVVVTCGEPIFDDLQFDTLLNPSVIVEVLSPSTEAYDRGRKFEFYRKLASLREYLVVSQDAPHIDRFAVDDLGRWTLTDASGLDAALDVSSIDCSLRLADVYDRIEFEADDLQDSA